MNNGDYDANQQDGVNWSVVSTYTIIRFTREAVSLKRVDTGGATAVLTGEYPLRQTA
jgi:hypothetical protein